MNDAHPVARRAILWFVILLVPLIWIAGPDVLNPRQAAAQDEAAAPPARPPVPGSETAGAEGGPSAAADPLAEDAGGEGDAAEEEGDRAAGDEEAKEASPKKKKKQINILDMLFQAGYLMVPILAMSLMVVTFGIERALALRRSKVLPSELISGLGRLAAKKGGLDPRQAYRLCQQFPSAAANVIKTMLLKVGRPHAEVEHTVTEANDREAARLYANVRWLGLGAGVTPLLGLLGTVQGMILAFFRTANLEVGQNRTEQLAGGIYIALVTTFSGLAVAIPAAVLAHWFEGRIQGLFRELDETLLGLMPQLERFEGRLRVSREQMEVPLAETASKTSHAAAAAGHTAREVPPVVPGQSHPAAAPK